MVTLEQIADEAGVAVPVAGSQAERQWSQWIANAMLQIRLRFGSIEELDPEVVDEVVRLAVAEKVRRPDAATQVEVSVDDGSVSRRYEKSSGQVTILDEWWAWLSPVVVESGSAFTIAPG